MLATQRPASLGNRHVRATQLLHHTNNTWTLSVCRVHLLGEGDANTRPGRADQRNDDPLTRY